MAPAVRVTAAKPASFEVALDEMETLLDKMEAGAMPLEQLLTQYQRGAELLKFCRERLEIVEAQIKVLDQGALKTWTSD
ncbi:MAG: exodeoxyribonuclease VII small subunit [Comamonadaceae bacterium]